MFIDLAFCEFILSQSTTFDLYFSKDERGRTVYHMGNSTFFLPDNGTIDVYKFDARLD